jgi:aspartate/methionine/tyrosine aminotransferase
MHSLARELNQILKDTIALSMLSDFGKRIYFPKGVVAQTDEAKDHAGKYNATVGMAFYNREVLHEPAIKRYIPLLAPHEAFAYSTTAGEIDLRKAWLTQIKTKNPDLTNVETSLPIVTNGITNGLMTVADLFIDAGDTVIMPDMFWGNYRLILEVRKGARIITFPFFNENSHFNLESLKQTISSQKINQKIILLLNFPNNPTGYSLKKEEAEDFISCILEEAGIGKKFLIITDDAYFGLFYEEETYKQSLFAPLSSLHENILAVKLDGATKEDMAWGFRIGFITIASKGLNHTHFEALERKIKGLLRSSISSCSKLSQSLLLRGMEDKSYQINKKENFKLLKEKYLAARDTIKKMELPSGLSYLPFNSGYFMCFKLDGAEKLRQKLLYEERIGTIAIEDRFLRVAFSNIEAEDISNLFSTIIKAV